MSIAGWYQHKADQCKRLAADATDDETRAKYKAEGTLWRIMARDAVKQERSESKH